MKTTVCAAVLALVLTGPGHGTTYGSAACDHQGQLPPASPLPPPVPLSEDVETLYTNSDGSALYINITIGRSRQGVLIDTGSDLLVVTEGFANSLVAYGEAHEGPGITTTLADGSQREERSVIIGSVAIGSHVLRDVEAGVTPDGADMLLGLPLLSQIGRFTIDTANHKLIFGLTTAVGAWCRPQPCEAASVAGATRSY